MGVGGLAHTDFAFVGGAGLTRIPLSLILLLRVLNLTDFALCVGFLLTRIQQIQQKIRVIRAIRVRCF